MFPAMEDLPQILTTEAGWTPKYEKIVHIDNMEHVSHKRKLPQTFDPCLPCIASFTKHATKQFPFTTRNYYTIIMRLATTMSSVLCGRLRVSSPWQTKAPAVVRRGLMSTAAFCCSQGNLIVTV